MSRLNTAVIDTSSLRSLQAISCVALLGGTFQQVLLPVAVRRELERDTTIQPYFHQLRRELAFLADCDDFDLESARLRRIPRRRSDMEDDDSNLGEAEAIQQAVEQRAVLIADDRQALQKARGSGLRAVGTVGLLAEWTRSGLMGPATLRMHFVSLRMQGRWLPTAEINRILAQFDEKPI